MNAADELFYAIAYFVFCMLALLISCGIGALIGKLKDRTLAGFFLGLLGPIGWLIAAIIPRPTTRCPECNNRIDKGVRLCPVCKTHITWEVHEQTAVRKQNAVGEKQDFRDRMDRINQRYSYADGQSGTAASTSNGNQRHQEAATTPIFHPVSLLIIVGWIAGLFAPLIEHSFFTKGWYHASLILITFLWISWNRSK